MVAELAILALHSKDRFISNNLEDRYFRHTLNASFIALETREREALSKRQSLSMKLLHHSLSSCVFHLLPIRYLALFCWFHFRSRVGFVGSPSNQTKVSMPTYCTVSCSAILMNHPSRMKIKKAQRRTLTKGGDTSRDLVYLKQGFKDQFKW